MPLEYTKHENIVLKNHRTFNEQWLQTMIADDPSILRLGDVELIERERSQGKAGRLDLLLSDPDQNRRYEVELMLGATDPSHIIRTIEYWDVERRRYPAYEHVAVLVAEDITSRFLNVLSLFSGSIPLIAIQLDALQVGDQIILNFVKVLDQTELRVDDEEEVGKEPATREYWENRKGKEIIKMIDGMKDIINEKCKTTQQLNYNRGFIGLTDGVKSRNFVFFVPLKKHVRIGAEVTDKEQWSAKLEEAGIDSVSKKRRIWIKLTQSEFNENRELVKELLQQAVVEFEE